MAATDCEPAHLVGWAQQQECVGGQVKKEFRERSRLEPRGRLFLCGMDGPSKEGRKVGWQKKEGRFLTSFNDCILSPSPSSSLSLSDLVSVSSKTND
mmetsp:Transcript_40002/g.78875  ORF Transcript_40002/g.78875 Transcript_40002/m.78875 type:complete len:97 (+) Transcript_40002:1146-1436(+)